jgi:hypothetical protein
MTITPRFIRERLKYAMVGMVTGREREKHGA